MKKTIIFKTYAQLCTVQAKSRLKLLINNDNIQYYYITGHTFDTGYLIYIVFIYRIYSLYTGVSRITGHVQVQPI